jgi:tetratricopeptide (TPR) repeat protein
VHTCFMRFPIDLLFIDRNGLVLKIVSGLQPWRFASCPGAFAVLEARSGFADAHGLQPGCRVGRPERADISFEQLVHSVQCVENVTFTQHNVINGGSTMINAVQSVVPSRSVVNCFPSSVLAVALALLASGCSTLDPTGEWRGLDRTTMVAGSQSAALPDPAKVPTPRPVQRDPAIPSVTITGSQRAEAETPRPVVPSLPQPPSAQAGLSEKALEALLHQAEGHYRSGRMDEAHRDFNSIIIQEPAQLHAWFRLGNLSHARGDLAQAATAYGKAIDSQPRNAIERESREKALANLAIIGLEQARVALEGLADPRSSESARDRARALEPLLEQRRAAAQGEVGRLSPRVAQHMSVDRQALSLSRLDASGALERPGAALRSQPASSAPQMRVESYLPSRHPN